MDQYGSARGIAESILSSAEDNHFNSDVILNELETLAGKLADAEIAKRVRQQRGFLKSALTPPEAFILNRDTAEAMSYEVTQRLVGVAALIREILPTL